MGVAKTMTKKEIQTIAHAVEAVARVMGRAGERDAKLVATVFADVFGQVIGAFDAFDFYRACGLPKKWIRHMATAKKNFDARADNALRLALDETRG